MQIVIGIQARTASTRLPGKIFELIGNKIVLGHVVSACSSVNVLSKANTYKTVIVCPEGDKQVWEWCKGNGVLCFEGSETDLVKRYYDAAKHFNAEAIVRVTGDCWNLSTKIIEEVIRCLGEVDYVANTVVRSFPEGQDCQGASIRALEWFNEKQTENREHPFVTFDENQIVRSQFVADGYTYKQVLNSANIIFEKNSIDTEEDLRRAREKQSSRQSN